MFAKNSIAGRQFVISLVLLGFLFVSLTSYWVYQEQRRFTLESEKIRDRYIQSQKEMIKYEVDRTIDFIRYKKSQTEQRVREEIKSRVYEAHAIATRIYDLYKNKKSLEEIKSLVRESLRPIRFNQERGYYFATAFNGIEELFADKPALEGKNLLQMQDTKGKTVIRDMIDIARTKGEGFYEYTWTKPAVQGRSFPKMAFVKHFAPFEWFIGTGEYLDDMEKEIQEEVVERISQIRFGEDGYIFISDFSGTCVRHPRKDLIGHNILELSDSDGVKIIQELIKVAQATNGDYVNYIWKKPSLGREVPKLGYAKGFPDWEWMVGTGVYLDDVESAISERLKISRMQVKKQLVFALTLFASCLVFTVFLLRFFSKRINKGIDAFVSFFRKSAVSYEAIDQDSLPFTEFQTLAYFSNKMVNDRKQAEDRLRRREDTLRSIFGAAPIGIGLVIDRVIKQVNERLCAMTGYTEKELLGNGARLLYLDDDEFQRVGQEKYDQIQKKGTGTVETQWKRKDGEVIDVLLSSTPLDVHDLTVGVTFTALDITDRKTAEEALKESEKTYRDLFTAMTDALFVINRAGIIVDVNTTACEIYGYGRDELIGMSPIQLIQLDYHPLFERFTQDISEKGHFLGQTIDVRKDGSTLESEIRGYRVQIKGEDHFLAIVRDVTERVKAEVEKKKTQTQLQRAQKLETVGTLAGGIAHDFNNLLSVVQGNVSLMLYDMESSHPHYENLVSIRNQVQSGARLTSQLLGYARKGRYAVIVLGLNQLVQDTSETFGRTRKDITIHRDLEDGACTIRADQGQIEQILLNLFVNAADAMLRGGELFLKTKSISHEEMQGKMYDPEPGTYILLTVRDTGTGMDQETLERVFDPFFTTKDMGRGTGLGLASTYGIVKSHKGYIDVVSDLGKGTTFSVYLPASENIADADASKNTVKSKAMATILLVDDEEAVLKIGKRVLERLGHKVIEVQNGKMAIEVFKQLKGGIDLVILDMVMPEMGGGEVYDHLKDIDPHVKVLLSSGFSIEGQATEIIDRGCDGFIQKPFTMNELTEAITQILGEY